MGITPPFGAVPVESLTAELLVASVFRRFLDEACVFQTARMNHAWIHFSAQICWDIGIEIGFVSVASDGNY
jgi:hypothetical protein